MLRCTIEMIPQGDETRARKLGIIEIANDATGNHAQGNYKIVLKKTPPWSGALKEKWKAGLMKPEGDDAEVMFGNVEGFDRVKRGPYDLLFRALKACGLASRNP